MIASRWAIAMRLARREVRRHPWRHGLVVALIFLPTLAVFATFSLLATWEDVETRRDEFRLSNQSGGFGEVVEVAGGGTVVVDGVGPPAPESDLPQGTVVEEHWRGADWFITDRPHPTGEGPDLAGAGVFEAPDGSRVADRFVVHAGRLPRTSDEILLTEALAADGGWAIGDSITSARTDRTFDVVGLGLQGDDVSASTAAVSDLPEDYWSTNIGSRDAVRTAQGGWADLAPRSFTSVWLPEGADPARIDELGGTSSGNVEELDARLTPGIVLGATAICALAAVVASAAFALASRRQLRTVGLLSTIGADPSAVRAAMILQGVLPGLGAGLAAVAVGSVASWWANAQGHPQQLYGVEGATISLSLFGAFLAIGLGTLSGAIAAWQPARSAAAMPVLSALAGRRPSPPLDPKVPLAGLIQWVIGCVLLAIAVRGAAYDHGLWTRFSPLLLIAGVVLFAFGGIAIAPLLVVMLDRLSTHARGTMRLVGRGLGRHRTQSAAAVAAIGVALALPIGFLTTEASQEAMRDPVEAEAMSGPGIELVSLHDGRPHATVGIGGDLRSDRAEVLRSGVAAILGPDAVATESFVVANADDTYRSVTAIDQDVADAILAPEAADALARGAVVVVGSGDSDDADLHDPEARSLTLRAGDQSRTFDVLAPPDGTWWSVDAVPDGVLIASETLGDYLAGRPPSGLVYQRGDPLTAVERARLEDLDPTLATTEVQPTLEEVRSTRGPSEDAATQDASAWLQSYGEVDGNGRLPETVSWSQARRALLVLTAISTFLALAVLTITLSLRSYDGLDDARAALAAGAPPSRISRLRAVEGLVLALLGAVLAVPLGWVPVTVARLSQVRTDETVAQTLIERVTSPGWWAVPVLAAPAILAFMAWWIVPAIGTFLRARRTNQRDLLAPRW